MTQQLVVEYPVDGCRVPVASEAAAMARGADGVLRYGDLWPALTELLDRQVHAFANREAVVEVGGPRLTYRELWHSGARIAGGLQRHGIGYGDRVAIRMPAGLRWIRAFLGALLSGAVPVLVPSALPHRVAEQALADSAADFVLGAGTPLPDGPSFIDDGASLGELAVLCYTSDPHESRGVELTNENLLSAIRSLVGTLDLPRDGVRNLVLLPLAGTRGCVDQLLPTFAVGGAVVFARDAAGIAEALETERVDMISATPEVFAGLCDTVGAMRRDGIDTRGVRRLSSAGRSTRRPAAAPRDISATLRESFPEARHWLLWGSTETSGIGLAADDLVCGERAAHDLPPGEVLGKPFGGTELALIGPDAAAGEGELLCRGPNVSTGYWNDPAATADRFTGGWFRTGDRVRITPDGTVHRVDKAAS
ncbi:class I adenylate-forming enzyme family protein [Nocardia farcinica]|uniref:class I adenylate-forming enzyme family protein n=1 Tax=Nocardia farcinica TaxID=37329 RepID=UPI002458DC5D|nr:AMP-binding protein [Nocardia farcinica]